MATDMISPNMNPNSGVNQKPKSKAKKVEDVVRSLAIEEWNARWLEELVAKVKGELTDSAEDDDGSDPSVSDDDPPTPISEFGGNSPKSPSMRQFQTTVEDDVSSQDGRDYTVNRPPDTARDSNTLLTGASQPILNRASSQLSSRSSSDSSFSTSNQSTASVYTDPNPKITSHLLSPPPSSHGVNFPQPRPTVHFSDRPPIIHRNTPTDSYRSQETSRSSVPGRPSTELNLGDVKWGRLFNERDEPTAALGQFLRGIANCIIAEYSPTDSLVIPPDKLYKFYTRFKLDTEILPLQQIFDTRSSKTLSGLEFLYTDLRCQHHLTQSNLTSKPHIPSLTPAGFEDWMTLLIRAFPEREAKRLNLVVAELPIEADPDTRSSSSSSRRKGERLPKQLPRPLFPARSHVKAYDLLVSSLGGWNKITTPEPISPSWPPSSSSSTQRLPPRVSKEDTRRYKDSSSGQTPPTHRSSRSKTYDERHSKHSREREHESRHRGSSDRSSRHSSPPRYHRSKRYRGSSADESRRDRQGSNMS